MSDRSSSGLTLSQSTDGKKVLQLKVTEEEKVEIPEAEFYTLMGHTLKVTPKEWSMEKTIIGEGETDMQGKPVALAS